MMRVELEPCYVLHLRPYRETSFIVYALTQNHGVIHLITRGVRNKHSGLIQPAAKLLVSWSGRGELYSLNRYEYMQACMLPDVRQKMSVLYLNELISYLVPRGSPSVELFDSYTHTLQCIASNHSLGPLLRSFEYNLLNIIGHELQLDYDVASEAPLRDEAVYIYEPDSGPRIADGHVQGWNVVRGDVLRAIREQRFSGVADGDTKRFLRGIIQYYLKGRVIKSRDIMSLC